MSSHEVIVRRLDDLGDDIKEIKEQVTATNGRVRKLELWQARLEGAKWAVSWAPPLITALISGAVGAILAALLT